MSRIESLIGQINAIRPLREVGRLSKVSRDALTVSGFAQCALGERVLIDPEGLSIGGEIVRISDEGVVILPEYDPEGVMIGQEVARVGPVQIAPSEDWLGRIVDPLGRPLDGRPLLGGAQSRPIGGNAPLAAFRRPLGGRLSTGMTCFDTILPLVRGQRIGLFAGSGVGKSTLLANFVRGLDVDVAVIGLVGERGRELKEFVTHVLGPEGLEKSVLIAATSDQSPLMRRRCAMSATAVAEYFRDLGLHVLLVLDSVTRFAEAHREVALASGEQGSLRGYPPSTSSSIMGLAERAGPGVEPAGDITAIYSVLVAGSDMEEPIADILRGTLDGHIVLDREIAHRGRYPAVDVLRSVSRSLPAAASAAENDLIAQVRRYIGAWDRAEMMVQAGLYTPGSDETIDRAIKLWPILDDFIAHKAPAGGVEASYSFLEQCLRRH